MIADAVLAAVAAEGVPEWVRYVAGLAGSLIVIPIVGVLVRALAKRLGVSADGTSSTPDTPTPAATSTAGPPHPPTAADEEKEIEELRAALADVLVDLRQAKAQAAAAEQRAAKAEARAERLQTLLETMAERLHRSPPPAP